MVLASFARQFASAAVDFLLFLSVLGSLEQMFPARPQNILRRGFWTDLAYYVLGVVLPKLLMAAPLSGLFLLLHRAVPGGYYAHAAQLPFWARLLGGLIVGDLGYYWGHRLSHELPLLWRFHAVHHQAEEMDWLVNTRGHPVDVAWGHFCGLAPLYILGLAQPSGSQLDAVPLLFVLLGSFWGFFIHANLRWRFGPLEQIVTSPAFHHWHHTNDSPALVDKNYASLFPWLDRLFGSYYLPHRLPSHYGVSMEMPKTLLGQLIFPFHLTPAPLPTEASAAQ